MHDSPIVHVVVGVVKNTRHEVLVTRRHAHLHQGGLLEFPGGKLEPGEDRFPGLQREFWEELGLRVADAYPLKKITHHYADKSVLLDVWQITEFSGVAKGMEGQPVYWLTVDELDASQFPAANKGIIDALNLPTELAFTPEARNWSELHSYLESYLRQNIGLVQLRQKSVSVDTYCEWYQKARDLCSTVNTRLMYSHPALPPPAIDVDGYHCSASVLMALDERPVARNQLFGASCHNQDELLRAESLGADYVTLSPVLQTPKYAESQGLGWAEFSELRRQVSLPVYALGGLTRAEAGAAGLAGAQGIAGIRCFASQTQFQ